MTPHETALTLVRLDTLEIEQRRTHRALKDVVALLASLEASVDELTKAALANLLSHTTLTQATALLSERLEELESGGLEAEYGDQVVRAGPS